MVLWESLSEAEREGELELTPEEGEELDRRWSDHVQRPDSSIDRLAGLGREHGDPLRQTIVERDACRHVPLLGHL